MIMANEDEKGRVPAAASSSREKPVSARDSSDDEKGALLAKEREAAAKLNTSGKVGEVCELSFQYAFTLCSYFSVNFAFSKNFFLFILYG
ncbi:unnamed protein product [Haemonchus placei]|uniref:Remorin_N domain-containing protein n=1 Tax=Haemonchus placei TaxID=6290 RepID=A0A0N4X743_HAEPC|nr:unnamed protein product [Haemonchus placei]